MAIDESLFDVDADRNDLVGKVVSFKYNINNGPPLNPKISFV